MGASRRLTFLRGPVLTFIAAVVCCESVHGPAASHASVPNFSTTPAGQTGGGRQRSLQRDGAIRTEPETAPAISGSIIVDIPATMCASDVELVVSRTIRNGRLQVFPRSDGTR
jgi:hypothetical protein